jgi:glucosamine 6-phosphate synthetase-like amidotransferase/phosphosugar isomerase protein
VITETLEGRIHKGRLLEESFGQEAKALLDKTSNVHIVACGTSFHAGLVARYRPEEIGIHWCVEVASEFRYREVLVPKDTLFVTISQSGETADTLAVLNALFLGRDCFYPIAMAGALKLKEISNIHAEAYPAGELKHGPLVLR